jgi:hypothetical protein
MGLYLIVWVTVIYPKGELPYPAYRKGACGRHFGDAVAFEGIHQQTAGSDRGNICIIRQSD